MMFLLDKGREKIPSKKFIKQARRAIFKTPGGVSTVDKDFEISGLTHNLITYRQLVS